MKSASVRGCSRGLAVGALLAMSVLDLQIAAEAGYSFWRPLVVLAIGLAAVLWPAARRPAWLTPRLRTAVPALLSLLYTAVAIAQHRDAPFGPGEIVVLLSLLFVAVRHCPPRWAVVCGALDAGALLATPSRYWGSPQSDEALAFALIGLVLVGLTAGLAAHLRSLDYRRTVAVADTRREERLAIAADLHDFVAHHVTGILVQTQMARMMAATLAPEAPEAPGATGATATRATDATHTPQATLIPEIPQFPQIAATPQSAQPQDLDPVLAGIERAATAVRAVFPTP
jgi:signal transduction histidine kinase